MKTGGRILEIGRGSGFVNAILNELGYKADSLDINSDLSPSYIGDISSGDIELEKKFELVLCAEVLEHIPFDKFDICLKNLNNLSNHLVFITLPNCLGPYKIRLSVNSRKIDLYLKRFKKSRISEGHFWELNYENYCTNQEIIRHMKKYFIVMQEGVVKENPYHYFYILKKISNE